MQALVWIFRLAIVAVLVWFAVKNRQDITLTYLPEQSVTAPLVFVLLVIFVAGVVIGLLAWIPTVVRQRRELARLRRDAERQAALAAIAPQAPAAPPGASPPVPAVPPGL
jgi:putative membrane protein